MNKYKNNPRILSPDKLPRPNNFFYRLFSSQRFLAILCLGFLIMILFPLAKTYTQKKILEKEIAEVQKEIDSFERDNQEMKEMIEYLQSEQFLEEQARLNLNLKKPGEQVVVINNEARNLEVKESEQNEVEGGNLAKWWRYFFVEN